MIDLCMLAISLFALIWGIMEYKKHKKEKDNELFSMHDREYMENPKIQKVVRYLHKHSPSDEKPEPFETETFLRFFEELGLYLDQADLNMDKVDYFFGYYIRRMFESERG